jgi:hypothetical protein
MYIPNLKVLLASALALSTTSRNKKGAIRSSRSTARDFETNRFVIETDTKVILSGTVLDYCTEQCKDENGCE